MLDRVFGEGSIEAAEGRPLADLFGADLFGAGGVLRVALAEGQCREGWRAMLMLAGHRHLVSLSSAAFPNDIAPACDPRVKYVLVVRPEAQHAESLGAPTAMGGLIARSPAMLRIFSLIDSLKHTDAAVLIAGESGTGKELVARAIHANSSRARGPFIAVNCAALPSELLESEMFGHTRGAFTGAVRDRVGRFEAASHGTLFLDEVGDLPLQVQVKLLRVLQDGTFERVGENHTRTSHARVIAATHVDLQQRVRDGQFRSDLFFRLRVVPVDITPLRERREDIEPLAEALLARVGARHGRALRFSPDALRGLLEYEWPGNVRELENSIEFAVAVCGGQTILPEHLPRPAAFGAPSRDPVWRPRAAGTSGAVAASGTALTRALEQHHWRREATAQALGISRITLWRRMREADLL
jgi:DNA-binding NtrC family response regulator